MKRDKEGDLIKQKTFIDKGLKNIRIVDFLKQRFETIRREKKK